VVVIVALFYCFLCIFLVVCLLEFLLFLWPGCCRFANYESMINFYDVAITINRASAGSGIPVACEKRARKMQNVKN